MLIHKFRKLISALLSLTLTSTMIPCGAANLVPFNAGKAVVTPSVPVTNPIVESKSASDGFSIQPINSKINDIIHSQKSNNKLQETYSGKCGDNLTWELNTEIGVLTISGTGNMDNYKAGETPWNAHNSYIKSVKIETGVTSIGENAFGNCTMSSVTLSDTISSIGKNAFILCWALKAINIPSSVKSIGDYAFMYCKSLTSISIPSSVTYIGNASFSCCENLESINVDASNTEYKSIDGVLFDIKGLKLKQFPNGLNIKKYIIPNSVQHIMEAAFRGCHILESITIPDSVTYISDLAFCSCNALKSITIPKSVIYLGRYAFKNCALLSSVTFNGVEEPINEFDITTVFDGCTNLHIVYVTSEYEGKTFCGLPIKKPGLSTGAIAGIVLGSIAAAAATVGTIWLVKHKCSPHLQNSDTISSNLL